MSDVTIMFRASCNASDFGITRLEVVQFYESVLFVMDRGRRIIVRRDSEDTKVFDELSEAKDWIRDHIHQEQESLEKQVKTIGVQLAELASMSDDPSEIDVYRSRY